MTCLGPMGPVFWERASGANVWDVDGNRFVDLGGGFGVANVGHGHPRVIDAVTRQSGRMPLTCPSTVSVLSYMLA